MRKASGALMAVAWITGARGFIGRHLAAHLASTGFEVGGIGHGHWPQVDAKSAGVEQWLNGEVGGANLDLLLTRTGAPQVIFHLAGGSAVGPSFANPLEDFDRTVHTTVRLLDWVRCNLPEVPVLAVSSAAVYGAGHDGPIAETARGTPYSPYGYHKAAMEDLLRSYGQNFGVRSAIVRVTSAYGLGLRKQILWDLCSRLTAPSGEIRLGGTGLERRDWIHVGDVARVLVLVAQQSPSAEVPVVNGGTGEHHSVAELAQLVLEAWGDPRVACFTGRARPGDPVNLAVDITRLRALGFAPAVCLATGVRDYVDWFRRAAGR